LPETILTYEDWPDFFAKRLIETGCYHLSKSPASGDQDIEIYSSLTGNLNTVLEIRYFSSMDLLYIHILNPETPGNNFRQQMEYFYKYDFDLVKEYGPPGLEFNETNIIGIRNFLDAGFLGYEVAYYKNGKPSKSTLTDINSDGSQFTFTYHFNREPIFIRLWNRIRRRPILYDRITRTDLRDIFPGLKAT
jgi:hypothetical protein